MALLADTSVWSLAYRRDSPPARAEVNALREALTGGERVVTTGLVLLELLQGFVPARAQATIHAAFSSLEFVEPTREDYTAAAALSNTCRGKGVQLATVDALIAQLCIAHDLLLLTTDADFRHATQHVPLRVWSP
jgi:predicted nucleic acid-binding protein